MVQIHTIPNPDRVSFASLSVVVVVPWATSSVCLISSLYRSRLHSWSYSDRSVDGSICISPPRSEHTHTQRLFPDVFNNFLKAASSLLRIDHRVRQFISSPAKRNDCLVKFCLRKQDGRGNSFEHFWTSDSFDPLASSHSELAAVNELGMLTAHVLSCQVRNVLLCRLFTASERPVGYIDENLACKRSGAVVNDS